MYLEDLDFDEDKLWDMVKFGMSVELVVNFVFYLKRCEGFVFLKLSFLVKIECEILVIFKVFFVLFLCKVFERFFLGVSVEKESVFYINVYENLYYFVV